MQQNHTFILTDAETDPHVAGDTDNVSGSENVPIRYPPLKGSPSEYLPVNPGHGLSRKYIALFSALCFHEVIDTPAHIAAAVGAPVPAEILPVPGAKGPVVIIRSTALEEFPPFVRHSYGTGRSSCPGILRIPAAPVDIEGLPCGS